MYIAIELPVECDTLEKKKAHIQKIYEWGVDNLEDQDSWKYFSEIHSLVKGTTLKFEFHFENEADAMAIKLAWS